MFVSSSLALSDPLLSLLRTPRSWLVTGAAGFIGSHLVTHLLALGQRVVGIDDFSSGEPGNLPMEHPQLTFIQGDIRDRAVVAQACAGVSIVLHHAAIGSVVKSIEDPAFVEDVNVGGTQAVLEAAQQAGVSRFVYASSSAVYGDAGSTPCQEKQALYPKSPYAQTKLACEKLASTASVPSVGLRYFNIYGPRQGINGSYAAVIPRWVMAALRGDPITIFGDGKTVRDFCFCDDVVEANLRAALLPIEGAPVVNIAAGTATSLDQLYQTIFAALGQQAPMPMYAEFRAGDIMFSQADITQAQKQLGFAPRVDLTGGLARTIDWYRGQI